MGYAPSRAAAAVTSLGILRWWSRCRMCCPVPGGPPRFRTAPGANCLRLVYMGPNNVRQAQRFVTTVAGMTRPVSHRHTTSTDAEHVVRRRDAPWHDGRRWRTLYLGPGDNTRDHKTLHCAPHSPAAQLRWRTVRQLREWWRLNQNGRGSEARAPGPPPLWIGCEGPQDWGAPAH